MVQKHFYPKNTVCAHSCQNVKVYFRSFDLFQFLFDNKKPLLDVLCRTRGDFSLSAKHVAYSCRKQCQAGIKLLQIQIINFMIFLHILMSACKSLSHVNLILFQNLHCDNLILEFIPKLRHFRTFQPIESLCITSTTLCKPLFSLFRWLLTSS